MASPWGRLSHTLREAERGRPEGMTFQAVPKQAVLADLESRLREEEGGVWRGPPATLGSSFCASCIPDSEMATALIEIYG